MDPGLFMRKSDSCSLAPVLVGSAFSSMVLPAWTGVATIRPAIKIVPKRLRRQTHLKQRFNITPPNQRFIPIQAIARLKALTAKSAEKCSLPG
jgi:hypothetical protein